MRAPTVKALLSVLFALGSLPALAQTAPFFDDVPSYKPYYNHVNLMRIRFITTGCTFVPSKFCPEGAEGMLTRGQAAVLIIRSIYSGSTGNPEGYSWYNPPQYFADVPPSHPQYIYIQKMAELGITSGCPVAGSFCPDDLLSYAQIATFAIRARMIRETGSISPMICAAQPETLAQYNCNPYFSDVSNGEFFFPYVQKAYDLIGNLAKPPNCYYGSFCPWEQVARGYFAHYAVSLIMNASTPYSLPNGGNLPNVTAPYNPQAGIYMSCESAATQNLIAGNMYVGVDANHVYTYASTAFPTGLMWPSLWMSYVWRQVSGPAPPYPAVADARLGNATKAELQSGSFSVSAGQTYTHTTRHGVISGCVSPAPAETPYIVSTQTQSASVTTQIITTSPPGLPISVDTMSCGTPCTYSWLTGTRHTLSAPGSQNMGGVQYQFGTWSHGATSTHSYDTPGTNAVLVASYTMGGGPYTVSATVSPSTGGTVTPTAGSYNGGTLVSFHATPYLGHVFDQWTIFTPFGSTTSKLNPLSLAVSSGTQVVASFRATAATGWVKCEAYPEVATTGTTVTLFASSSLSGTSYSWTGQSTGTGGSLVFVPSQPGGYLFKVTASGVADAAGYCYVAVAEPTLATFRNCISSAGQGNNCQLPTGTYLVPPRYGHRMTFKKTDGTEGATVATHTYLKIQSSGITISGGATSSDTVLKRAAWNSGTEPPAWPPTLGDEFIMEAPATTTNVVIRDLTFDGNRQAPGLNCLRVKNPDNSINDESRLYDLAVSRGGRFTLGRLEFVNSPGTALDLGGDGSSISLSTFGHGGEQTATRSTAIFAQGANNQILFNSVHYAGTAAINFYQQSTNGLAYGNSLFKNRYEISDDSGGGQLYLEGGSRNAIVAGNVIHGGGWPPEPIEENRTLPTGCKLPLDRQYNAGVEGYGFDHFFFNNEIVDHTGSGMQFAGSNPTERITVSSAPYRPSADYPLDTVLRYIESNRSGGIVFIGQGWCAEHPGDPCHLAKGVTLDAVFVANNALGSISLENVTNDLGTNSRIVNKESSPQAPATHTGFFNGACLIGNKNRDEQIDNTPEHGQALNRPLPSSMNTYVPSGGHVACPPPPWPSSVPVAAPQRPGWPW